MKLKFLLVLILIVNTKIFSQVFTTNTTPVGMEHNLLFNATTRYDVTPGGNATFSYLHRLFDGEFLANYTPTAPTISSPTVILIENLPERHIQAGAWVGWSTRHWPAIHFKIEGYNSYGGSNTWNVLADYSTQDYEGGEKFVKEISPSGAYTKLRFTFYTASGTNGRLGISELFFIHPEAMSPYEGLLLSEDDRYWSKIDDNISYTQGNVGIGTTNTDTWKLAVNGDIRAKEIKVETGWSDFVFENTYQLPSLKEVENHIQQKGHLKDIPSAKEVEENGIFLGQMDAKLLQKIEELTLYTIQQQKEIKYLSKKLNELEQKLDKVEKSN